MSFKHFTEGINNDFITEHYDEIVELLKGCLPLNNNKSVDVNIYDKYVKKIINDFNKRTNNNTWFFMLQDNIIQCLCVVSTIAIGYMINSQTRPITYELYDDKSLDYVELASSNKLGPTIYSLCKREGVIGAGKALLDYVFSVVKENNDHVYLIQESILFKDNYSEIYNINNCSFLDLDKYKESNDKLSSYYKSIGFKLTNYYDIHKCNNNNFIFFNIFVKDLSTNKLQEEYTTTRLLSRISSPKNILDRDKLYGAIYGVIYGDSFGSRYEFMTKEFATKQIEKDKNSDGSYSLKGGGYFNFSAGQVTDDSEMMFALLDAIVDNDGYDQDKVALNYIRWFKSMPIDKGKTISKALYTRTPALNALDMVKNSKEMNYSSLSNGSLMRIVPLGVFGLVLSKKELKKCVYDECDLTHPNKLIKDICFVYCLAIKYAIKGYDKKVIFDKIIKNAELPRTKILLKDSLDKPEPSYVQTFSEDGAKESYVDTDDQYYQGYIGIALQNTFYEFMHTKETDKMKGVTAIVNVAKRGGDTDTNCAIMSGLLGAYYGTVCYDMNWFKTIKISSNTVKRYKEYPFLNPLSKMERSCDMLYTYINNNL